MVEKRFVCMVCSTEPALSRFRAHFKSTQFHSICSDKFSYSVFSLAFCLLVVPQKSNATFVYGHGAMNGDRCRTYTIRTHLSVGQYRVRYRRRQYCSAATGERSMPHSITMTERCPVLCAVASLGLLSPGAASGACHPIFLEKTDDLF